MDNHTHDLSTTTIEETAAKKGPAMKAIESSPAKRRLSRSISPPLPTTFISNTPVKAISAVPAPVRRLSASMSTGQIPTGSIQYTYAAPGSSFISPASVSVPVTPGTQKVIEAKVIEARPSSAQSEVIEKITCGHTRYGGEHSMPAEVPLGE